MIQDNSKDTDRIEVGKGYYESGALQWETPFVNGEMHGISKWYYRSGALWYETPYVNGNKHGIVKVYYESGALMRETPYVNGKVHGIGKTYNRDNINIDRLTLYNKDRILLSHRRES